MSVWKKCTGSTCRQSYAIYLLLLVVLPQCWNLLKLLWDGFNFPRCPFPLWNSPAVSFSQWWVMWIPLIKAVTDLTHVLKASFNFHNYSALYEKLLIMGTKKMTIITHYTQVSKQMCISWDRKICITEDSMVIPCLT